MKTEFQGTVTGPGYGYVYVMSYPGSDKVKIGHALNPTARAKDIGGTLAPEQPVLEAYFWCSERREDVERATHNTQRSARHNGEWFRLSVEEAVASIRKAASSVGVTIQLAYDRNEWEAKIAAKEAAKLAAIPALSDDELTMECNRNLFFRRGRMVSPETAYTIALEQEQRIRRIRAKKEEKEKERAEEDAAAVIRSEERVAQEIERAAAKRRDSIFWYLAAIAFALTVIWSVVDPMGGSVGVFIGRFVMLFFLAAIPTSHYTVRRYKKETAHLNFDEGILAQIYGGK